MWTGRTKSFAGTVMIAHVSSSGRPSARQQSHTPAKANGPAVSEPEVVRDLLPALSGPSLNPSAGTRHRRPSLKACSKGGVKATDSARALIGFGPVSGSFAHDGTNPHFNQASPRVLPSGLSPTTATI